MLAIERGITPNEEENAALTESLATHRDLDVMIIVVLSQIETEN